MDTPFRVADQSDRVKRVSLKGGKSGTAATAVTMNGEEQVVVTKGGSEKDGKESQHSSMRAPNIFEENNHLKN